jgi:dTDP-4-amino-4,6-dideoxygalactose transaminase
MCCDAFNMDAASLRRHRHGAPRGQLLPGRHSIDLYGQPADYRTIEPMVKREKLLMLCDTAQAFGATLDGKQTAATGDAAATSFYPTKPLGCYGDGGACFTNDEGIAQIFRSIRNHGEGTHRYEHARIGLNSRLDTIQAAVLIEKVKIFPDEIEARDRVARRYTDALAKSGRIGVPRIIAGAQSVWAQYTIQVENRAKLQDDLKAEGIPTAVHYPIPLGRQRAYREFPSVATPIADALAERVVSVPMHPYLDEPTQDRIIAAVLKSAG